MLTLPEQSNRSGEGREHVLVLSSPFRHGRSRACIDLLTASGSTPRNVLSVVFAQSPRRWVSLWEQYAETKPTEATIISVEADSRSVRQRRQGDSSRSLPGGWTVEHVYPPDDLTRLGVHLSNWLEARTTGETDPRIGVCFGSLSSLLQYVDTEAAFEFLDTARARFSGSDCFAHYHMNPGAHDDRTIETFLDLFDAIYRYDGEWTLESRC